MATGYVLALGADLVRTPTNKVECDERTKNICRRAAHIALREGSTILITAGDAPKFERRHLAALMETFIRQEFRGVPTLSIMTLRAPRFNTRSEIRTAAAYVGGRQERGETGGLTIVSEDWRLTRVKLIARRVCPPLLKTPATYQTFFDSTVSKKMLFREKIAQLQNWLWLELGIPD